MKRDTITIFDYGIGIDCAVFSLLVSNIFYWRNQFSLDTLSDLTELFLLIILLLMLSKVMLYLSGMQGRFALGVSLELKSPILLRGEIRLFISELRDLYWHCILVVKYLLSEFEGSGLFHS